MSVGAVIALVVITAFGGVLGGIWIGLIVIDEILFGKDHRGR
jgi:hypothetical protein